MKKVKFLSLTVTMVLIATFIFTAAMIVFSWQKGWEMTELINNWYPVMIGQLTLTALIQVANIITDKIKAKNKEAKDESNNE